jgi:hypothetical protein
MTHQLLLPAWDRRRLVLSIGQVEAVIAVDRFADEQAASLQGRDQRSRQGSIVSKNAAIDPLQLEKNSIESAGSSWRTLAYQAFTQRDVARVRNAPEKP